MARAKITHSVEGSLFFDGMAFAKIGNAIPCHFEHVFWWADDDPEEVVCAKAGAGEKPDRFLG